VIRGVEIEMATKPDCVHYDWGDTAPREYGAFCKVTCEALSESTCEGCELYEKKNELNGNERWLKESQSSSRGRSYDPVP